MSLGQSLPLPYDIDQISDLCYQKLVTKKIKSSNKVHTFSLTQERINFILSCLTPVTRYKKQKRFKCKIVVLGSDFQLMGQKENHSIYSKNKGDKNFMKKFSAGVKDILIPDLQGLNCTQ